MVQVDVFWSYGLGASMGLAAGRQLVARRAMAPKVRERLPGDPDDAGSLWRNPFFLKTVLFAALLFAPSGAYLLWAFPDWETMQAGTRDLPAWLVVLFAVTNVTQAALGFWVVERLLVAGRRYAAFLQVVLAYLGMFFVLVHGWDGEGWKRFLSPDAATFRGWDGDWARWFTSDVAIALVVMGVVMLPVLFAALVRWQRAGYESGPGAAAIVSLHLAAVFGAGLGLAVGAHALIAALGAPAGITAAGALVALALMRGGPVHRLARAGGWAEPDQPATTGHFASSRLHVRM